MKGYKITTNGKCLNLRYEVGKIYTLNGKLEICKTGFHFCLNADDLFDYYCYKKGITKIFEIEAIGEIIDSNDKSVTNKIKIIREIPFEEYNELFDKYKFNEIGQLITKKYMKYGKLVIFNYIYDNNGNLIKEENNKSSWIKYQYDEKGNVIKTENANGYWEEYTYDEKGNVIKIEEYTGFWTKYEYDEKGNVIKEENANGYGIKYEYTYDEKGNIIYKKNSSGSWTKYKYDEKGNVIKIENFNGYWEEYMYDKNGSMINYNNWYGNNYSIIIE